MSRLWLPRRTFLAALGVGALRVEALPPTEWQSAVAELARVPREAQPSAVNAWWNLRLAFVEDPQDVWQTPQESLTQRKGDCEDFAFAKYSMLRQLGWKPPKLRLAYGRVSNGGRQIPHMVALVDTETLDDPLVLDNLGDFPVVLSRRWDLEVVFMFSEDVIWEGSATTAPRRGTASFTRWTRMVQRMRAEGSLPAR